MALEDDTRNFWYAAYYVRRAPERPQSLIARRILRTLADTHTGRVAARARAVLEKIEHGKQRAGHS